MSDIIKKELNSIEIPNDLHARVVLGVQKAKEEMGVITQESQKKRKKRSLWKKMGYISGAAVIAITLLFATATLNPAVADMLNKIPFFNTIIKSKKPEKPPLNLDWALSQKLWDAGYKYSGIAGDPYKRTIEIRYVGSELEYFKVKDKLKTLIVGALHSYGIDNYTVTTMWDKDNYEALLKSKKDLANYPFTIYLRSKLSEKGYTISNVWKDDKAKLVTVTVPADKEIHLKAIKDVAMKAINTKKMTGYKVDVIPVSIKNNNQKRDLEDKWSDIIPALATGLPTNEDYKIKGVSFKYTKSLVTVEISTALDGYNNYEKSLGKEIEQTVKDFINAKPISDYIEHQPYQVIVKDINKRKIN